MKQHLALFRSTHAVIRAERLCRKHGLRCSIIPLPRTVSSDCGMAIEIDPEDMEKLKDICRSEGIEMETVVCEKGRQH